MVGKGQWAFRSGWRAVDLISRTALAAVACPQTGANAHRLIVAIASSTKSTAREPERKAYLTDQC